METEQPKNTNGLVFHWIENLVGSGLRFQFNLLISLVGGSLYAFGIWATPIALAIFGVLSPLIFTLCLYSLMRYMANNPDSPFPTIFTKRMSGAIIMLIDMLIIVAFAVLIHADILNFLFFRLLQTVIFPAILIVMLRVIFLTIIKGGSGEEL